MHWGGGGSLSSALARRWDAGTATFDHTPAGRGYGSALFYFSHIIDAWTFQTTLIPHGLDLYEQNATADGTVLVSRPAEGLLNPEGCGDAQQQGCTYADKLFEQRAHAILDAHDAATPLFLFWAPCAAARPDASVQSVLFPQPAPTPAHRSPP